MNKIVLLFLILPCWGYGQLTPLNCPLEKWEVPAKGPRQGEAEDSDLRAFISDKLKLKTVEYIMFLKNTNRRYFQLKKEPGMLLYELQFHPEDAYLALKGQGRERLLPLYLLLHAIAHTDLKHETANEAEADIKAGEWLALLGINWEEIEAMLAWYELTGQKANLEAGYQKEGEMEIVKKPISPALTPASTPAAEPQTKEGPTETELEIQRQREILIRQRSSPNKIKTEPRTRKYPIFINIAPRHRLLC